MVEAEKSMFGDMFNGELEIGKETYKVGNDEDGEISFTIECLDQNAGMQVDCTSRVIWKASIALSEWFNK